MRKNRCSSKTRKMHKYSNRNRRVLNLVSVETIARVLVISKWERRKQQASDDSQDASRDRQTRSTAFSVSASSVFLLLAAYARTDMRRSQHTLCGGADDYNEAIPLCTEETAGLQVLQSSVSYSLTGPDGLRFRSHQCSSTLAPRTARSLKDFTHESKGLVVSLLSSSLLIAAV